MNDEEFHALHERILETDKEIVSLKVSMQRFDEQQQELEKMQSEAQAVIQPAPLPSQAEVVLRRVYSWTTLPFWVLSVVVGLTYFCVVLHLPVSSFVMVMVFLGVMTLTLVRLWFVRTEVEKVWKKTKPVREVTEEYVDPEPPKVIVQKKRRSPTRLTSGVLVDGKVVQDEAYQQAQAMGLVIETRTYVPRYHMEALEQELRDGAAMACYVQGEVLWTMSLDGADVWLLYKSTEQGREYVTTGRSQGMVRYLQELGLSKCSWSVVQRKKE